MKRTLLLMFAIFLLIVVAAFLAANFAADAAPRALQPQDSLVAKSEHLRTRANDPKLESGF